LIERFFNKIKQSRRAAGYDKPTGNYLAFIQFASIRLALVRMRFDLISIANRLDD